MKLRPFRGKDPTDYSDPTWFLVLHIGVADRRQSLHRKTQTRDPYARLNACHSPRGVRAGIRLHILRIAEHSRKRVAKTKLELVLSPGQPLCVIRWMRRIVGLLHDSKRKKGIARLPVLTNKV